MKKKKADLNREWGIPAKTALRYTGLRGVYWYWLSRDIRQSEWERYDGECLTCLKRINSWEEGDCGHVIAARWCGEYLRFHRRNLTIQHKGCNNPRFCPSAGVRNALNYNVRYGEGAFEELMEMQKLKTKVPSQSEYKALINSLPSYQNRGINCE